MVALVAYLLGSVPFGYLLVRLFRKADVRQTGSGNIGATNVARMGAPGLAALTLVLDAAKGFLAVKMAMAVAAPDRVAAQPEAVISTAAAVAALFAILGHVFPVWLKFRGGRGVATGVGSFLALAPKAVLVVLVIFSIVVFASRYVSLGSIIATALFPVFAYLLGERASSPVVWTVMSVAAALIIARHRDNIRRLIAGTENRLSFKPR